jgi:hypothetical protein
MYLTPRRIAAALYVASNWRVQKRLARIARLAGLLGFSA